MQKVIRERDITADAKCVDILENLAIERAKELFGCEYVCVQPHSGANANTAVYQALLEPGDTVMGMNLAHGGHLTHGSPVNLSGILYHFVPYGVNDEGYLDYDEIRKIAQECKPKMIVAGASAYARIIDLKFREDIADEVGAYLMVDMAHIAGLVAAGLHPEPDPVRRRSNYNDTQDTARTKRRYDPHVQRKAKNQLQQSIFPGIQGGPLMHVIAAKAVCFKEALQMIQRYIRTESSKMHRHLQRH